MENLKSQILALTDVDLLNMLEFISDEVKNRNLNKVAPAEISQADMVLRVENMVQALKDLGLSVESARNQAPRNGYRPGHGPRR